MPSQILHTLFGEDLMAAICRRLNGRFGLPEGKLRSVFALGCQGPDIFYHSQHLRPVAIEYGSLPHRRSYGALAAALLASARKTDVLSWYALGFMTHAALDRACHPYIVYKSLDLTATGPGAERSSHPFFERIIDVLMLRELRGIEAAAWDQEALLAEVCKDPPPGLKALAAQALVAAYGGRAENDAKLALRIDNAFTDSAYYYHFSAPARTAWFAANAEQDGVEQPLRTIRFLSLVFPENLPGAVDFLNMKHEAWYYPYTPPRATPPQPDTRSFPAIYADALRSAETVLAPVVDRYLSGGAFSAEEAATAIGNGSLSIQDGQGKPAAPNLTDPLPLGEVLLQQARMRGIA